MTAQFSAKRWSSSIDATRVRSLGKSPNGVSPNARIENADHGCGLQYHAMDSRYRRLTRVIVEVM